MEGWRRWRGPAIGLAISLAATIATVLIVNFWGYSVPGLLTVALPALTGGFAAGVALRHTADLPATWVVSGLTSLVINAMALVAALNRGFPVYVTSVILSLVFFAALHGLVASAVVWVVRRGSGRQNAYAAGPAAAGGPGRPTGEWT